MTLIIFIFVAPFSYSEITGALKEKQFGVPWIQESLCAEDTAFAVCIPWVNQDYPYLPPPHRQFAEKVSF